MVHIVPSISFLKTFIKELEKGSAVSQSIRRACEQENTPLSTEILMWSLDFQQKGDGGLLWSPQSHYQLSFKELLKQGLQGAPVYQPLLDLENEMLIEFEIQWKSHLETLPVKLSIPMLFFFFPAYVVLLFGPLITKFMKEFL